MKRWLACLAAVVLSLTPAWAQNAVPCVSLLGDFWGTTPAPDGVKTLDGTAFRSPQDLARAVGEGAIVQGGNFSEWDFRGIRLTNACFVEADLKGSVWTNADTPGIGFIKSDLAESLMTGIKARGVLFRDAGLANVKADKADFSGGQFEGGWFDGSVDGWNIDGANLTDFAFSCGITLSDGCPVFSGEKPISARGANLTRTKISSFRSYGLMDVDLAGAILEMTEISASQLLSLRDLPIKLPLVLVGGDLRVTISAQEALALIADARTYGDQLAGPSFDCAKAATATEILLCEDRAGDIKAADLQLGRLFAQLRKVHPQSVTEQRQWLKQRDRCTADEFPSDCLRTAYGERIGLVLGHLGEQDWLAKGQGALFIEDDIPLSDAMRASPLFARIAPVLASAAMARVYVTRAADGSYSASGDAVGANAHTCSLGATAMRLDPLTGWYAVLDPGTRQTARIFRIIGDGLEVFASGRADGDMPEASMDYASCGARAAFGPMRRIALPPDLLKRYAGQVGFEP